MWNRFIYFSTFKFAIVYIICLVVTCVILIINNFALYLFLLYAGVCLAIIVSILFLLKIWYAKDI